MFLMKKKPVEINMSIIYLIKKWFILFSKPKQNFIGIYFKLFMNLMSIHQITAIVNSFRAECDSLNKTSAFVLLLYCSVDIVPFFVHFFIFLLSTKRFMQLLFFEMRRFDGRIHLYLVSLQRIGKQQMW